MAGVRTTTHTSQDWAAQWLITVLYSKKERADTTCIRVLIECPRI